MPVSVLTPAAYSALISLSQVQLYLGAVTAAKHGDALLTSLISTSSSTMIRFLGVNPARQRYLETGYGNGGYRRYLSRLPVEQGTLTIELNDAAVIEGAESENWVLEDPATGLVYRQSGWTAPSSAGTLNLSDTYYAGFLLPDQVSDWQASHAQVAGSWVRPTSAVTASLFRFECTTAGTTGSTQPTWPTTLGSTVTDGGAVWTARAAQELPPFVSMWCYAEVLRQLGNLKWVPGTSSRTVEGVSESRFATQTDGQLPPSVKDGLLGWRSELGVVGVA